MAKMLRPKVAAQKKPTDTGRAVQKSVQIEVQNSYTISQGNDSRNILYEEFMERIQKAILAEFPDARVTSTGGYYLIDGKMCRHMDFDPKTMDRKPGTFPPSWSVAGDEKKAALLAERAEEVAKNPPKNAMAMQPPNLLTAKETEEVAASRRSKLPPGPRPKPEEPAPQKKVLKPTKKLRRTK